MLASFVVHLSAYAEHQANHSDSIVAEEQLQAPDGLKLGPGPGTEVDDIVTLHWQKHTSAKGLGFLTSLAAVLYTLGKMNRRAVAKKAWAVTLQLQLSLALSTVARYSSS